LLVNGLATSYKFEIKEHIVHFYNRWFIEQYVGGPSWMTLHFIPLMRRKPLG
jgi:hypothetical protein